MAHVGVGKFAGKTQKVKLLQDIKIAGVPLSKGDTCDVPVPDAVYLKNINRVEFVANGEPKESTR